MRIPRPLRSHDGRPGTILMLMVIMITALIGMLGLVIDGGLMMAAHRQTQNAADSASLVAALYLYKGRPVADARAAAVEVVHDRFGITEPATVHSPPSAGPHPRNPA